MAVSKITKKAAFLERQKQIAIERGLIKAPVPVPVEHTPKRGVTAFKTGMYIQTPPPEWKPPPCPCHEQGLTKGRHDIAEGVCMDGVFYSHGEISNWKTLKFNARTRKGFDAMKKAIKVAKDILGLDMEHATIHARTCQCQVCQELKKNQS